MLAFKLAYRNLMGARLRTWLNVFVLSLAFIVIIWFKGIINGWDEQARRDTIDWQIGGGQYWQENYDPYDPFTIEDSHTEISAELQTAVEAGKITPILISQATMYPEGRIQAISLRGIDPRQEIIFKDKNGKEVNFPTKYLTSDDTVIPAMIGKRLAKNSNLSVGDFVTIRWRDVHGTFDADEVKIVHVFDSDIPVIDTGILYVPLSNHQKMMRMPNEATMLVTSQETGGIGTYPGWDFKDNYFLLSDIREMIEMKSVGGSVYFIVLMSLAMLAIFDTQVLSIFRRQKEIGTHIALGMTQRQVVALFTIEGAFHSILAAILAAVYGVPLLWLQAVVGWRMPAGTDDFGLAIAEVIYPKYSLALVLGTTAIVLITTTIVSYLPARRISKMEPTEAIRGKIQ